METGVQPGQLAVAEGGPAELTEVSLANISGTQVTIATDTGGAVVTTATATEQEPTCKAGVGPGEVSEDAEASLNEVESTVETTLIHIAEDGTCMAVTEAPMEVVDETAQHFVLLDG